MMCTTFFFCQVAEKIRFWRVEVQLVFSRLWGKDFYGLVEPCIPLNIIYMILLCKFLCQLTLLCAFRMWLQPLLIISSGLNGLSGKKLLSNSPSASWYPAPLWICCSFSKIAWTLTSKFVTLGNTAATGAQKVTLNSKVTIMGIQTLVVLVCALKIDMLLKWLLPSFKSLNIVIIMNLVAAISLCLFLFIQVI